MLGGGCAAALAARDRVLTLKRRREKGVRRGSGAVWSAGMTRHAQFGTGTGKARSGDACQFVGSGDWTWTRVFAVDTVAYEKIPVRPLPLPSAPCSSTRLNQSRAVHHPSRHCPGPGPGPTYVYAGRSACPGWCGWRSPRPSACCRPGEPPVGPPRLPQPGRAGMKVLGRGTERGVSSKADGSSSCLRRALMPSRRRH